MAVKIELPEPYPYDYEKDRVISYSEINTYRNCPLDHHMTYVERWSKPAEDGSPLFTGTLYHNVLEAHYTVLKEWQEANPTKRKYPADMLEQCEKAAYKLLDVNSDKQSSTQALVQWMYDGYVEMYGLDEDWIILAVEYQLAEPLPDPRTGEPSPYVIKAKLDLIVMHRKTRKIWVIDHKSGKNLPQYDDLDLNDQFGLYTWLLRKSGLQVLGSIHGGARTQRNQADFPEYVGKSKPQMIEDRYRRTTLNRTDAELDAIARDAWAVAVNMYPEDSGFQSLPLYSSPMPNMFGYNKEFKEAYLMARKGAPLQETLTTMGWVQNFERH